MPNLPTSLILVVLAAAWIWVLVPMFARSREAVPETDDEAAGFRVLRRAVRRSTSRRSSVVEPDEQAGEQVGDDLDDLDERISGDERPAADLVDDLADDDTDDRELLEAAGIRNRGDLRRLEAEPSNDRAGRGSGTAPTSSNERPVVNRVTDARDVQDYSAADDDVEDYSDAADYDEIDEIDEIDDEGAGYRESARDHSAAGRTDDEANDADRASLSPPVQATVRTWSSSERRLERPGVTDSDPRRRTTDQRTAPARTAARPHRPGRGGFDPVQAEVTARYRFRRRRLISLTLLLLAVGFGVGTALVDDRLWMGATVFGLALVGYLTYLSRQVKIERAIRERRMARMRRAREIRPAAVAEPAPTSPYRAEPRTQPVATAPHTGPERRASYSSHVPPSRRRGYTVVDLDDDDPAFDDLERYEPVVYRRAAGQ